MREGFGCSGQGGSLRKGHWMETHITGVEICPPASISFWPFLLCIHIVFLLCLELSRVGFLFGSPVFYRTDCQWIGGECPRQRTDYSLRGGRQVGQGVWMGRHWGCWIREQSASRQDLKPPGCRRRLASEESGTTGWKKSWDGISGAPGYRAQGDKRSQWRWLRRSGW